MLVVEAIPAINPGVHDLVRGICAGRSPIGAIHVGLRGGAARRPGEPGRNAAPLTRVERVAETTCREERDRASRGFPAIKGLDQDVRSVPREAKGELVAKQIDPPVAVGSDPASRNAKAINIIDSASDLLLCPVVPAIPRRVHPTWI